MHASFDTENFILVRKSSLFFKTAKRTQIYTPLLWFIPLKIMATLRWIGGIASLEASYRYMGDLYMSDDTDCDPPVRQSQHS